MTGRSGDWTDFGRAWTAPFPGGVLLAAILSGTIMAGTVMVARAAPDIRLAPHRAAYDLTLATIKGGDTVSASGTMTYAVTDACTAWSTQQELRLQTVSRSGGVTSLVSDYATLESKDGRHLVFRTVQTSDGRPVTRVMGEATTGPSGGEIHYTQPVPHSVKLPAGTLFPMAHTAAIIRAAGSGAPSISPMLFDGTGDDGAQYTYVMLLGWGGPPSSSGFPALAHLPSGRVHVAFYTPSSHDMRPDYAIGMRYFANGVSDQLDMDFGDFTMRGTLRSFSLGSVPPGGDRHRC
ncbi:cell envelope integrity EipB family protein [Nguyenibacter sp. L1]|uniref:cell envelope integrity EipB family protein n=1 Tax=Nguyenibacter sp. L1 TaxID=3049350 RepID=UPI002B4643B9|nr:cell envelope integrity EipB family protein [Nguyenibacter sp. L1]WRH88467.1 cell envelope integrity EipB family protein [Nguyenibacter sp. L1]